MTQEWEDDNPDHRTASDLEKHEKIAEAAVESLKKKDSEDVQKRTPNTNDIDK